MNDHTPLSSPSMLTKINDFIKDTDIRTLVYAPPFIGFVGCLGVMLIMRLFTGQPPYPPFRDILLGIAAFSPCFSGYAEIYKKEMPGLAGGIYKGSWAIVSGVVTIIIFGGLGVILLIYGISALLI